LRIRHIQVRNFRGIKALSWRVKGNFNCIVGPGDTCKTTILTAIDYALSPRTSLVFDDSDFFNQDIAEDIVIQVTLAGWDETQADIRKFFQESKFAQYKCGLDETGPLPEPQLAGEVAVSISLRVDKSLEPKWSVVRGRDDAEDQDRKPIYSADREVLGLSRLDILSDSHFTWGRNTILTRLSADNQGNLNTVLSELAREMRQSDISQNRSVIECQTIADAVRQEAQNTGVKLAGLTPKVDIQRQSSGAGAMSLHEDNVPLRNKGSGSKKLIAAAMQMKLHDGKNISLIDEIELGLEPHRIRGLIYKLRKSHQQIFATTHSSTVLKELNATDNELHVCKRDTAGIVQLERLGIIPDIQGRVRSNPDAFLGSRIIACEGATEMGCLRAYDTFRLDENDPPIWSLATSYFNCGSIGAVRGVCLQLVQLGYQTAVLCDNDAPEQLSAEHVRNLQSAGVTIFQWANNNSTERQLFADLPWQHIPALLTNISQNHDTLELASIIDSIRKEPRAVGLQLSTTPSDWPESGELRLVMGDVANRGSWIKRMDYAAKVFHFALPLLPATCVIQLRLGALWTWVQRNEL
jgi:putative ATP-dependent endonuclease of OLD family